MPPGNPPPGPPPPPGWTPPPPQPYQVPPGAYPPPPPGAFAPPRSGTNWWAIVSLVFGLLGGVLISVVCSIIALKRAKQGQGGRGMAIAGLVLSGLWVLLLLAGIAVYLIMGRGSVGAHDVKAGDCLTELPTSVRVSSVQTVSCEQPHKGEVYAVLTMPEGAFPGQAAIDEYQNKCRPELATYSPDAAQDPAIDVFVLHPSEESWKDGDRSVTCIASSDSNRTGSLKG